MKNTFMQKEVIGALVAALILGGGVGYYGATKMGGVSPESARGAQWGNREGGPRGPGMMRGGPGARGAGFASGEVIAQDDMSITVKAPDGSTKIILVTESTEVMNATKGTVQDVEVGKNVMVNGTPNQDGSVTAQSVNIRPAGMGFPGRGGERSPQQ